MEENDFSGLENLSTTEIIEGLVLYMGKDNKFSEQAFYKFFRDLETKCQALSGRFRVKGSIGNLQSEPLRQSLSFLEMGKVVEIAPPNPVDQFYRPRGSQLNSVEKDLQERDVLPHYKELLMQLGDNFYRSLKEASDISAERTA